jgi:myosin heavy subunit
VLGAEIKNYLLEKSRVVGCTEKERNYHVFFFMMRGVSEAKAKQLGLLKPDGKRKDYPDFKYLSKCNDLSRDDDIAEYKVLVDSFNNLGFTEDEQDAIHRMTAAAM